MVPGQIQLPEPRNNTTTLHSLFAAQDVQRWYWSAVSFALISGHLLTDSWNPSLRHLVWLQQLPLTHLTHGTRFCLQHFVIEYIPIPVSRAWSDVKWIRGADLHSRSAGHKIMCYFQEPGAGNYPDSATSCIHSQTLFQLRSFLIFFFSSTLSFFGMIC